MAKGTTWAQLTDREMNRIRELLEIEFDAQGRRAGKLLTYQQIADKFEIDVGEVRAMVRR